LDDGAAKVAFVGVAAYQASAFGTIHELYRAVVAKHHAIRKVAYRGWLSRRRCSDNLQKLVLLSLNAVAFRGYLAKAEKLPQLETEFGKLPQTRNLGNTVSVPVVVLFHEGTLHSIAQRFAI